MKTVGLRPYSISPHEFPITILITASGLPVNLAVIGQPRIMLDGVLIERLVPEVDEDLAAGTLRYQIDLPSTLPAPFDLTQTIDCWFTADAFTSAQAYGFRAGGDGERDGDSSSVSAYLIRPDGYISYRSSALDPERLLTHLSRTLAPVLDASQH